TNNHFWITGYKTLIQLLLRRSVQPHLFMAALLFICFILTSCEKDFDIKVPANKPMLVVEAYINNEMPLYNYVILTRSLDYLSLDFQGAPVSNAKVTITEGQRIGNGYKWDTTTKVRLMSVNVPGVPPNLTNNYFDPRLVTDWPNALLGTPGKSYLLEISEGGNYYSAITNLLQPVQIDSLTTGFGYLDEEDGNKQKYRITNHYKDPDTLNNTQLFLYRFSENRHRFGWGGFYGNRNNNAGTDELTNGQYMHITHSRGYLVGDTVTYHMASVTRDVYNFWKSFNDARNNGGPFATPVTLTTNITGPNVTGCFSGMSLSSKTIIIK
ncbi:MAG: DUF4249 domain-containing protein, partial [Flavisolibacter sp.]|nr:DUF4249 domain-containing protein [Flavisolibacter sp.]